MSAAAAELPRLPDTPFFNGALSLLVTMLGVGGGAPAWVIALLKPSAYDELADQLDKSAEQLEAGVSLLRRGRTMLEAIAAESERLQQLQGREDEVARLLTNTAKIEHHLHSGLELLANMQRVPHARFWAAKRRFARACADELVAAVEHRTILEVIAQRCGVARHEEQLSEEAARDLAEGMADALAGRWAEPRSFAAYLDPL